MSMSPTRAAIEARRLSEETKAAHASGDLARLQMALAAETYGLAVQYSDRKPAAYGSARQCDHEGLNPVNAKSDRA